MKKLKKFLVDFSIFIYTEYVYEDFDIFTKTGKIVMYPFWFIRACIIWIISPIFIPVFFFKQSAIYGLIKKITDSPEYQKRTFELMNKMQNSKSK